MDVEIDEKRMQILRDLVGTHRTVRYGVLMPNVHQTVESHTNRMLALAPVMAGVAGIDYDDYNMLNALILAHDLPELGMERDVTVLEQVQEEGAAVRKKEIEEKTRVALVKKYGRWLWNLFDEYERQESEPARFVKWLDKYEASRHMLEIAAYSRLQHRADADYVSFFVNTTRLIAATQRMPSLLEFTKAHLEGELREAFVRNGRADKYDELRGMLWEERA